MEGVGRLSRGSLDAVRRVWEGYLEGVERLSGGFHIVWRGYIVGVGRLSGGCKEALRRV